MRPYLSPPPRRPRPCPRAIRARHEVSRSRSSRGSVRGLRAAPNPGVDKARGCVGTESRLLAALPRGSGDALTWQHPGTDGLLRRAFLSTDCVPGTLGAGGRASATRHVCMAWTSRETREVRGSIEEVAVVARVTAARGQLAGSRSQQGRGRRAARSLSPCSPPPTLKQRTERSHLRIKFAEAVV